MPTYVGVMLRILDENKIPYKEDIVKTITPLGYRGTAEYYKNMGISLSVEEMMNKMRSYMEKEYTENIQAKSNVKETLIKMKVRGDDLHVLTASPHATLDPCLKRLGLFDLFSNVWSCDDFNTTKADPDIYKSASEKIGKRVEEIIFLDDNYNALKTAKNARMRVYGVFDLSSEDYAKEIKEISEKYITDFSQLL